MLHQMYVICWTNGTESWHGDNSIKTMIDIAKKHEQRIAKGIEAREAYHKAATAALASGEAVCVCISPSDHSLASPAERIGGARRPEARAYRKTYYPVEDEIELEEPCVFVLSDE
jgi:hypothetical protein